MCLYCQFLMDSCMSFSLIFMGCFFERRLTDNFSLVKNRVFDRISVTACAKNARAKYAKLLIYAGIATAVPKTFQYSFLGKPRCWEKHHSVTLIRSSVNQVAYIQIDKVLVPYLHATDTWKAIPKGDISSVWESSEAVRFKRQFSISSVFDLTQLSAFLLWS